MEVIRDSSPLVTLALPQPAQTPVQSLPRFRSRRRILCVSPRYVHSFGTFDHAFPLMGVRAFMPPQGLLVIAAYLPPEWEVRFVDENIRAATAEDFQWADAVFVSGMHVQGDRMREIIARAHAHGKIAALGGPSVSACPHWYPEADLLHVGELGDGTDALLARLDASVERPEQQEVYRTETRLPLEQFPVPAYSRVDLRQYFLGSIQFSSGCPFRCEFCDIPELYGRNPRLKTPVQITAELDAMLECGAPGAVYFVDDNFIGNPKAALALLKELVQWQEARGFPVRFACEATLNLAQHPQILELMRDACFGTVFCGIETPEVEALSHLQKKQNLRQPILAAVETLNSYGLEVVSGIIMGLDTDTPTTGERILEFIEASGIPLLTINLLQALPRTPLWRRLEAEGRLVEGAERESNVQFLLPHEQVVQAWRNCVTGAYRPEVLYERFRRQVQNTYPHRRDVSALAARPEPAEIRRGLAILARVLWRVGVLSDYRRVFWRMAGPALRRMRIEEVIHIGVVAYHLIRFSRECAAGTAEQSFYATRI